MRFGLDESVIEKINSVLSSCSHIEKAIIYGSRAKGTFKNGSDIDITLKGGKELNVEVLLKLTGQIDDLLLPYTADLSIFTGISNPDLVEHINRVGQVFYTK
jgi:predicted nucleotidyltransferase